MSDTAPMALPTTAPPARAPKRGRTAVNIAANLAQFGANTAIAVFFIPYLVHHFGKTPDGKSVYGIVPLAWTVTQYMSIITLALNGAVGRFITIALERGEREEANRLFNTSLFGSLAVVSVLAIPGFLFALLVDRTGLVIPVGYEAEARVLFACTVAAFLLNTLQTPFDVASYCRNRFDIRNLVIVAGLITRVALVVLLFHLFSARIFHVGMGFLLAGVVTLAGAVAAWRYLTPELHIRLRSFNITTARRMLATGLWITVSQVGTILFLAVDLLVLNQTLGTDAAGLYQPVLQWSLMLRSLATFVAGVFGPTIVALYARHDIAGMVAYTRRAIRFVGLAIALPTGIICGFADPLLRVWLHRSPQYWDLGWLMVLLTLHLSFNLGYLPLSNINIATNHVRIPGIVQVVAGLLNLALGLILVLVFGWGMYGVAAAGAIVLTLRNVIFTPLYTAHVLEQPPTIFLREVLPITALTVALGAGCWLLAHNISLFSWPRLIAAGIGVAIVYAGVVYLILGRDDRQAAIRLIARRRAPSGTSSPEPQI